MYSGYFTTICRELGEDIEQIFFDTICDKNNDHTFAASDNPEYPISRFSNSSSTAPPNDALIKLGQTASVLLSTNELDESAKTHLRVFAHVYLQVVRSVEIPFACVRA